LKKTTIAHNKPTFDKAEEKAAIRVLRSSWVVQGKEVEEFENEFCAFLGLSKGHAVAVSSGTAALFLALTILGAKGKKVSLPVYACSALRNATVLSGGKEVLLDTENGSPNIDLIQLKKCGAKLAIVPHMYGLPVDISKVKGMDIIEDCAQALGASVNGIPVGLQGKVGIFSFYATKLMTSGGQGGMIVSKYRSIVDSVRDFREFDQRHDNKNRFNLQMTDLQAAIGRVQLNKLPSFLKRRSEIFEQYKRSGLDMLDLQKSDVQPIRYRAVLKTRDPNKIIRSLARKGIKAIVPIENWELLKVMPNALKLTKGTVSLPLYPSLTDAEVDVVLSGVKQ